VRIWYDHFELSHADCVTRITIHNASWDYGGKYPRHGTRVTSLAEKPYFDPSAPTRRQALGLLDEDEKLALGLAATTEETKGVPV